jgi:hypothetical protein
MTSESDSDSLDDLAARANQEHATAVDALGGEQNHELRLGALAALLDRLRVEGDAVPEAIVNWAMTTSEFCSTRSPANSVSERTNSVSCSRRSWLKPRRGKQRHAHASERAV